MFSRRRTLDGSRKYTRETFEALLNDLTTAGFDVVDVLLPHNIVRMDACTITPAELLARERNYPSLILRARAAARHETLKVLFVNNNAPAVFADDTFPNGESEPPQLYFQSPDPGRAYAVFEYFHEYLQQAGVGGFRLLVVGALGATLVLAVEALALLSKRSGALALLHGVSQLWDFIAFAICSIVLFRFLGQPRGLWIKPKRELRLFYLANMALRGELRDNPLVSLIVSVCGTIFAAVILKWLGIVAVP